MTRDGTVGRSDATEPNLAFHRDIDPVRMMRTRFADPIRASSTPGLHQQAGHMAASDLCAARQMISCQASLARRLLPGGGHPHMKRREFIALVGGAGAGRFAVRVPRATLPQDAADWVTASPRAPVHVAAWPAGRKVAVSFALFVEEFGFGQGPVFRADLATRNPDLVNEA